MFKNAEFAEFTRKTQIALTALRAGDSWGESAFYRQKAETPAGRGQMPVGRRYGCVQAEANFGCIGAELPTA